MKKIFIQIAVVNTKEYIVRKEAWFSGIVYNSQRYRTSKNTQKVIFGQLCICVTCLVVLLQKQI